MRRLLPLGFVLIMTLPAFASTRGATAVTSDCFHTKVEPTSIIFACADANWYAGGLHWTSWQTATAEGHGLFHFNDCTPNCAGGTFHTRWGQIALSLPRWCKGDGVRAFRHASITYNKPWHHRTHFSTGLPCPLT